MDAPRSFARNATIWWQKNIKINRKSLLVQNKIFVGRRFQVEMRD